MLEAFNLIDMDRGGSISLEELRRAMLHADVGITTADLEYTFKKVYSCDARYSNFGAHKVQSTKYQYYTQNLEGNA